MLLKGNRRLAVKVIIIMAAVLLLVGQLIGAADAKEPSQPEITLNQAIAMALDESNAITKAEHQVQMNESSYDDAVDNLDFIPIAPGTAVVESAYAQTLSANLIWQISQKSLTAEQDKTVLDTCNKYWAVLNAQAKLDLAQASLDYVQVQLINARASERVGMLANSDLIAAEAQVEMTKASLAVARNDLDGAYIALNQQVGLWAEDRPVLVDTVEYVPVEVADINYEVARVLSSAPAVWQAEQAISMQNILQKMAFYSGSYTSYENRKLEVVDAELDAATTKQTFEKLTYDIYNNIMSLEESYAAALQSEKVAAENYRIKELKFQLGMITQADLTSAKNDCLTAENNLFNLACQHAYLKLIFEKPWAA